MYSYSFNNEEFEGECATREDALDEARGEHDPESYEWHGPVIYTGENVPFEVKFEAWRVLDALSESAYDFCAEHTDGWLQQVPEAAENELEQMLAEVVKIWMVKHKQVPTFWRVKNVVEHPAVPDAV